jgi:uncharacterized protein YbgA (DUF1722 family)/uncharacterized protein YbbK (DUF523 family)
VGEEILVGVSACLLGQSVRHDGGHKRDAFLTETLAPDVRFVPVCPEVEIGLGVPREAIHLRRKAGNTRLVGVTSGRDHTEAMIAFARRKVAKLAGFDLCGYILKKGSPSCGMERVAIHVGDVRKERDGRGVFAATLLERLPLLPVEEEGRLQDAKLRENFIERLFAYRRIKRLFARRWSAADLVGFHSREKMLLLAHDRPAYAALGRLVARAGSIPRAEMAHAYAEGFMSALKRLATRSRHANVLLHMAGFLRKAVDGASRRELTSLVEDYRLGTVPLIVPLTLIRHHVRVHAIEYLAHQSYLEPHPRELALRNHV